jgi:hypothetical protein
VRQLGQADYGLDAVAVTDSGEVTVRKNSGKTAGRLGRVAFALAMKVLTGRSWAVDLHRGRRVKARASTVRV